MNTELAKTLTVALVQFLDRERPEGSMCCSNTDCENIRGAFEEGEYEVVESFIQHKLTRMTKFERALDDVIRSYRCDSEEGENGILGYQDWIKRKAKGLLELAKKELCGGCTRCTDEYWHGRKEAMEEASKGFHYEGPAIPTYFPSCYHGGPCTNPMHDCINCPRQSTIGINTTTGTSTAKVEG